jgi:hypothetical protein
MVILNRCRMEACACEHLMKGKKQPRPSSLLASISVILLFIASSAFSGDIENSGSSSIVSNFNGTSIAGGDYLWFSAVFKPTTTISLTGTTNIYFQNQTISFTSGGVSYNLSVPNSQITFSPTATTATTVYNASTSTWVTTIPANQTLSGNVFLSGLAFQVPAGGLAGGINPVTWSGSFSTDQSGLGLNWQWAAANYTSFSSNYTTLGIKPVDANNLSSYKNSDHAGTPENFDSYVVGGARGGGGSNYTGSLSATASDSPPILGIGQLTIITKETPNPNVETRSDTPYDVQAIYTVPDPSAKLYLTRTWQMRSPNNVFGQATQDPNTPYTFSIPQKAFPLTQDFGNFSPMVQYGLETWTLSYGPANGSSPPIVLDTKQVYIYPKSSATVSDALKVGASPTSLATGYQGDAPRVKVEIDKSYPGGTTWVAFYLGTVPSSPPVLITPVANSSYITSTSDMTPQRFVYVDVGNLIQNSATYSIQVIQNTAAYGAESLAAATFNVNPSFQVNSVVGLTK